MFNFLLGYPRKGSGYVPSSSASDDYFDALKADSRKKIAAFQARIHGHEIPDEVPQVPPMPGAYDEPPQVGKSNRQHCIWCQEAIVASGSLDRVGGCAHTPCALPNKMD